MLKPVRRKGSKTYYARGTVAGRRIERSTGTPRLGEAKAFCARLTAEILERYRDGAEAVATFAMAVNAYLDAGGESRFLPPLLSHFGPWRLATIDQAAIDTAARTLYPKASPSTRRRQVYVPMTAVLNAAADRGYCPPPRIKKPKVKRQHREPADEAWFKAVLPHCSPHLGALLITLCTTGMRVTEALSLRWRDVDLSRRVALLRKTKSGGAQEVDLPTPAVIAIANIGGRSDPVFRYGRKESVYKPLRQACKAAGVPYKPTHELGRHAFASWLLADGWSLKHVAEAGRWKSIRMVGEVYGHLERREVRAAIEETAGRRSGILKTGGSGGGK